MWGTCQRSPSATQTPRDKLKDVSCQHAACPSSVPRRVSACPIGWTASQGMHIGRHVPTRNVQLRVAQRSRDEVELDIKQVPDAPPSAFQDGGEQHIIVLPETPPKEHDWPTGKGTWPAPRPWAQVLGTKLGDTYDDIMMHLRRNLEPLPTERRALMTGPGSGRVPRLKSAKPVVLVLGTGWGAHSMVKVLNDELFEVVVVSPRNHFVFTPMLPSTAVGTVEFRSLLEPIRVANPFISYFGADCESIDLKAKVARCRSTTAYESGEVPQFEVRYDVLVVAVGEQPATFGVPGVAEHCYFMKEVSDCVGLRNRVGQCFELAALPNTSEEDRRRTLSFIVVGGGPTGVEFAGTLNDFVRQDLKKKYPMLMKYVRVTLLQSAQTILSQFSSKLQERALENLISQGIDVRTGVRVTGVNARQVSLKGGEQLDYGVCVWSTGNATRPLVASLVDAIPAQREANAGQPPAAVKLAVDPFLRVVGAEDVLALGDCCFMTGNRLPATAQVAGQQGAYAARAINRGYALGKGGLDQPPPSKLQVSVQPALELRPDGQGFRERPMLVRSMEQFNKPFEFLSLGIMAYVGNDRALTQVEAFDASLNLYGALAFLLWRSVYITKQVSFRNRVLILFDWLKAKVFGRDLSQF